MGLPDLSLAKFEKCQTGSDLAHVSAVLWRAQTAAKGQVQWELPSTSLVLMHDSAGPILGDAFDETRPVCQDGAPWQKYTTIKAASQVVESLSARCNCNEHQIKLRGKAPDGRWWTAHASVGRTGWILEALNSRNPEVRSRAVAELYGETGDNFDYDPNASVKVRRAAVERVRESLTPH